MKLLSEKPLSDSLFAFYLLFIFSSTFSIALAQISLGISLFLFIILLIKKPFNPFNSILKRFYLLIAAFILWQIISALGNSTPLTSLEAMKKSWLFLAVTIGIYLGKDKQYRQLLVTGFALGVLMIGIYGIFQYIFGIDLFRTKPLLPAPDFGYLVRGNFPHTLTFGNYFATASIFLITLLIAGKKNIKNSSIIIFISAALLGGVATLFSFSRGSIFAMIAGLLILILVKSKRPLIYAACFVLLIGSITIFTPGLLDRIEKRLEREYNLDDEMGRLYIWNSSFKLIKENPILGVGNGNFAVEYAKNLPPNVEARKKHVHAHNDLLNFAAIFGLPGMILYLLIWLELFHIFWKAWKKSSVEDLNKSFILASFVGSFVFFVTSFTEATFIDEEVRQMLMFIWAIGLGSVYNDYEK